MNNSYRKKCRLRNKKDRYINRYQNNSIANKFLLRYVIKWVIIILIVTLLFILFNDYFYNPIEKDINDSYLKTLIKPQVPIRVINNKYVPLPKPLSWQSPAEKTGNINIENISKINNAELIGNHNINDLNKIIADARNVTGDAVSDFDITF